MFTVTAAQAQAIILLVDLVNRGITTLAQYHQNLNKVLGMNDDQLNKAIADEEFNSDLLMAELDKM